MSSSRWRLPSTSYARCSATTAIWCAGCLPRSRNRGDRRRCRSSRRQEPLAISGHLRITVSARSKRSWRSSACRCSRASTPRTCCAREQRAHGADRGRRQALRSLCTAGTLGRALRGRLAGRRGPPAITAHDGDIVGTGALLTGQAPSVSGTGTRARRRAAHRSGGFLRSARTAAGDAAANLHRALQERRSGARGRMTPIVRSTRGLVAGCVLAALSLAPGLTAQNPVTAPEQFFGFRIGGDNKLARWDKIVEYMKLSRGELDRVRFRELGKSTQRQSVHRARDQRARHAEEPRPLQAARTQAVFPGRRADRRRARRDLPAGQGWCVLVTCSIHATEIGASQMARRARPPAGDRRLAGR